MKHCINLVLLAALAACVDIPSQFNRGDVLAETSAEVAAEVSGEVDADAPSTDPDEGQGPQPEVEPPGDEAPAPDVEAGPGDVPAELPDDIAEETTAEDTASEEGGAPDTPVEPSPEVTEPAPELPDEESELEIPEPEIPVAGDTSASEVEVGPEVGCPEGAPCDDGDACTAMDVCVAGECIGQPLTSLQYGGEDTFEFFTSGVAIPNGGYALVGAALAPPDPAGKLLLVITDPLGKPVHEKFFDAGGYAWGTDVAFHDGSLAIVGFKDEVGTFVGTLLRTDLEGAELWAATISPFDSALIASSVAVRADGALVVGGTRSEAGDSNLWLGYETAPAGPIMDFDFGDPEVAEVATDVQILPESWVAGGGYALVGHVGEPDSEDWGVLIVDSGGAQVGEMLTYGQPGPDYAYSSLLVGANLLIVGAWGQNPHVLMIDSSGSVGLDQSYTGTGNSRFWDVVQTDGGLAFAGFGTAKFQPLGEDLLYFDLDDTEETAALFVRADLQGTVVGEQSVVDIIGNWDQARRLIARPDGGYALVGFTAVLDAPPRGWLAFLDDEGQLCGAP